MSLYLKEVTTFLNEVERLQMNHFPEYVDGEVFTMFLEIFHIWTDYAQRLGIKIEDFERIPHNKRFIFIIQVLKAYEVNKSRLPEDIETLSFMVENNINQSSCANNREQTTSTGHNSVNPNEDANQADIIDHLMSLEPLTPPVTCSDDIDETLDRCENAVIEDGSANGLIHAIECKPEDLARLIEEKLHGSFALGFTRVLISDDLTYLHACEGIRSWFTKLYHPNECNDAPLSREEIARCAHNWNYFLVNRRAIDCFFANTVYYVDGKLPYFNNVSKLKHSQPLNQLVLRAGDSRRWANLCMD